MKCLALEAVADLADMWARRLSDRHELDFFSQGQPGAVLSELTVDLDDYPVDKTLQRWPAYRDPPRWHGPVVWWP